MNLSEILDDLLAGRIERADAMQAIGSVMESPAGSVESLGFAHVDHDRAERRGFPEVIYGPGKTPEQLVEIFASLEAKNPNLLATRVEKEAADLVRKKFPEAQYDAQSKLLYLWREKKLHGEGTIAVVSAGTSDGPVAKEAALAAQIMGNAVECIQDVGVAGLHRLLGKLEELRKARVLICVAGFEAALPSVVTGLVASPVIAVPTSVGYGVSKGGVAALMGCLSACSAGVTTVNIDNGFGAAYAARFDQPATLKNRFRSRHEGIDGFRFETPTLFSGGL